MDAKRIKLDLDDENSRDSVSQASVSSTESVPTSNEVTVDQLRSPEPKIIEKALLRLKASLRNKTAIEQFMDPQSLQRFYAVVDVLVKAATDITNKKPPWLSILKDSISLIANCCNYSITACLKMTSPRIAFTHIAVRVFESRSLQQDCKTSMARLVANMCTHKEPAMCIASNPSLVDRLVLLLESDDRSATQALRAIRGLIACTYIKVVLLSNVGFYLGKMLAEGRNTAAVVATLTALAGRRVRDTGRQLAGSISNSTDVYNPVDEDPLQIIDCAERLLELFFSGEVRGAKELLVLLCEGSTDMRDRMGEARAIQKIIESADDSALNCKLLAAFAQEAWGRAALREFGALDFLISRLSSTSSNSSDRLAIVQPLRHFVHDTNGMAFLARNRIFVDTVVKDVKEFIAENKVVCEPEIVSDEDMYRPDSPLLMEIESCLQKKVDYGEDEDSRDSRLHKDYSSLWAYSTPSPNRSSFSSPMYSPPSSGAGSPVSAFSSSPLASPFSHPRSTSESVSEVPDLDPSPSTAEARQERTTLSGCGLAEKWWIHIIESELWLLTWQAQEDANLPFLCKDDVVNAVLSYLALAPSPDYRIGRVLRRLACSRPSIDSLLSMQFHTRVLHTLCMVPCRVVRYAKRCARCERAAEFGKEILREFASHVDSDFGNSFLIKRLSSEDFTTRVVAAIAKVALIRDRFRLGRMSSGSLPALDLLFDSLHTLLMREDFLQISDDSTYSGGPPICAQIVGAISTLVSSQRLREILDADAAVRPQERGECLVEKYKDAESDVEMLIFNTKEGELLARVPMDAVCKGSLYFQGMFTSDLQEKFTKRRNFVFCPEEEDCSAEDFTRFLHHLSGCRAQCSLIHSAQACVAMVKLSDRYLCPALSEYVSSPHGPARRLLNGETLPVFLPAVLTAQTHERLVAMCLLTLIRYCTSSQIVAALRSVSNASLLVDSFIEQLKAMTSS